MTDVQLFLLLFLLCFPVYQVSASTSWIKWIKWRLILTWHRNKTQTAREAQTETFPPVLGCSFLLDVTTTRISIKMSCLKLKLKVWSCAYRVRKVTCGHRETCFSPFPFSFKMFLISFFYVVNFELFNSMF